MPDKDIRAHEHRDKKRLNNPEAGIALNNVGQYSDSKTYKFDPHLDPSLDWTSKAESTELTIRTQAIHIHERINPKSIIDALRHQPASSGGGARQTLARRWASFTGWNKVLSTPEHLVESSHCWW